MHNDPKETPPTQTPETTNPVDADSLLPGGIGRDELLAEVRRAVEKELRARPPHVPGEQPSGDDRDGS